MAARGESVPFRYYFDDVIVDGENFRVLKSGQSRTLEPRVFDLLVFFIENRGRVLEKQELFEQVWKQAFVTDNALTRAVKEIRRAIGDDASAPRYIETIPKRGYRFIAEVRLPAEETSPQVADGLYSENAQATAGVAAARAIPVAHQSVSGKMKSAFLASSIKRRVMVALLVAAIIAAAAWLYRRNANLRWARAQIPRIEQLAEAQRYFEAYDLAIKTTDYLPDDPAIARLMPVISDTITVTTEPSGASVYLKRFSPDKGPRELVGSTPITSLSVARGDYIMRIEKDGYATFERTISTALSRFGNAMMPASSMLNRMRKTEEEVEEPSVIKLKLIEADRVPVRMVFVPGSDYTLVSWGRLTEAGVKLNDYSIDKYEVTNREYKEFINAGGYFKKQYWKHPFIKDGREMSWEETMRELKDRTGLPGPRSWSGQNYPEGKDDYPVTDITWYEASAYAEFRGKRLPTIFEWEKAARDGIFTHYSAGIMPWGAVEAGGRVEGRANFKSDGPASVDQFEFGMSPYGCYNTAGNVAEWCFNQTGEGFLTAGASWDDLSYLFSNTGIFPGLYSSSRLGFRCAISEAGDQGAMRIEVAQQAPVYTPTSDADFKNWLSHYRYDKTPLGAEVIEAKETDEWRREKIAYIGANDERAVAYLYLPKNYQKPFQVIQFVPAGDVYGGYITIEESVEMILTPLIKSGRAVFAVVFKGFKERERPPNYVGPSYLSVKHREEIVANAIDLRRGLDYLETRDDIEASRIAYFGYSQGAEQGLIYAAVEPRYRSVVFVAGGLPRSSVRWIVEASPFSFAPHVRAPKLMLNGRYDEAYPFHTEIEPLFKLLRDPKRSIVYDAGHTPPIEVAVPAVNDWFDETLGRVKIN